MTVFKAFPFSKSRMGKGKRGKEASDLTRNSFKKDSKLWPIS